MNSPKTTLSQTVFFRVLIFSAILIFGLTVWAALERAGIPVLLFTHAPDISRMISTATVGAIGLMSAAVVLVTAGKDSHYTRWYRASGAQANLVFLYLLTVVTLLVTHTLCLFAMVNAAILGITIAAMVTNTVQLMTIIVIAHRVAGKQPADV